MKKLINLLISMLAVALVSCGGGNRFTISGSVPSVYDGTYAVLVDMDGNSVDSVLVENATVSFKGIVDSDYVAQVFLFNPQMNAYDLMLLICEPGKIYFEVREDNSYFLSGSPLNDDLYYAAYEMTPEVQSEMKYCDSLMMRSQQQLATPEEDAATVLKCDSLRIVINTIIGERSIEMIKKHPNDILGVYLVCCMSMPNMDFGPNSGRIKASFDEAVGQCGDFVKNHPAVRRVMADQQQSAVIAPGAAFPDFVGQAYGSSAKVPLSQIIDGHVALVDFWASWCKPCRQEISENIIRIYEQYKDKGLVVVGVDVNDDAAKHEKASDDLGITYPQIIDVDGEAMKTYAIESIPQIFLINSGGTLIAQSLRGEEIEKAVRMALHLD